MRPKIIIHSEMSVDGRVEWIEKQNFLYYRILTGWDIDAMITDADTLLCSELRDLNKEVDNYNDQTIIVLDKSGVLTKHNWKLICEQRWWNDKPLAVVTERTAKKYLKLLDDLKINYICMGKKNYDFSSLFKILRGKYNFHKIRIDSDGRVNGTLLREGMVDMLSIVFSPRLTGNKSLNKMLIADGILDLQDKIELKLYDLRKLEGDFIWLLYEIIK